MATMICNRCNNYGIYWRNLSGLSPYTYCPHCDGINCQAPEIYYEEENLENECSDGVTECGDK